MPGKLPILGFYPLVPLPELLPPLQPYRRQLDLFALPPPQVTTRFKGLSAFYWRTILLAIIFLTLLKVITQTGTLDNVPTTMSFPSTTSATSSVTGSTSFTTRPFTSTNTSSTMSDTSATQTTTPSTLSTSTPASISTSSTTSDSTTTSTTSSSTIVPTTMSFPSTTSATSSVTGSTSFKTSPFTSTTTSSTMSDTSAIQTTTSSTLSTFTPASISTSSTTLDSTTTSTTSSSTIGLSAFFWRTILLAFIFLTLLKVITQTGTLDNVPTTMSFPSTSSASSSVTDTTSFKTSPFISTTTSSTMSDTSATQTTTSSTLSTSTPASISTSSTTLDSTTTSTTGSSTIAPTCGSAPVVTGLVAVPSGGAHVNETKVYRCENPDETFPQNVFNPDQCPVITCLSDGTYNPSFSSKAKTCQALQSSPPGDDTQTSPGTITSPGFDGNSPYNSTKTNYRWNIVTTGSQLIFNFATFDVINGNDQCNNGDILEITCGFKDNSREFKLCSGSPPVNPVNCSVGCAGIVFVVDDKTTSKGVGFSFTWTN